IFAGNQLADPGGFALFIGRGVYAVYDTLSARSAFFRDSRTACHTADIGFIASGKARKIPRSYIEQSEYSI
ncbi:MAG: hypothetical protein IJQ80_06190, partial [Clostridia bacterium]|nr:hypothetical protein [Clostridia bacterium]